MVNKKNWGGVREGAGRPRQEVTRKQRQTRAYDDEWELIKEFSKLVKTDINRARELLSK